MTVTRKLWPWLRLLIGVGILGVLVWRLGTGAFVDGLRVITVWSVLAALVIGLLTTVFMAWRWCLVARRLGLRLSLGTAIADYYLALFLNTVLPAGVLGDVHRAVSHGRQSGDVGRGIRAVVLERFAGQVVLLVVGVTVLLTQPALISAVADDLAGSRGVLIAVLCVLAVVLALAAWAVRGRRTSTWHRALATALTDGRVGLLARDTWPGVALLSAAAVVGHLALFVVAARVAGSPATIAQLLPPLVLALLVMGLPVNIGGWGPREAISTLAFGAAGLGATQGLTVAVVYGVLTLVSSLPGAVVRFRRRGDWQARPAQRVEPPDDPLGGEAAARGIREPAGQLGGSGRATARVLPTAVPRSRQGVLLPEMVTRGADLDGVPAARACRGRLPPLTRPGRHRDQPSRAWMGSTANIDCGPPHSPMMMALVSSRLRAIARETVAIAERGSYRTTPGDDVIIGDKVARAVANTRLYQPDDVLPAPTSVSGRSTVEIANESSLAATQRLGGDIACLVFASARNPGGGFLNGAQAQEESLARGSGLYPCLRAAGDFYGHHRAEPSRTSPTATA